MAAEIRRLNGRPARIRQDENAALRQALLPFRDGGEGLTMQREAVRLVVSKAIALIDGQTASHNKWSFVMLSPGQNHIVVEELVAHSRRPMVAVRLWALCFQHLRMDTGEIVLTREDFAERLGVEPAEVSEVMSHLVRFGAISRQRERVAGLRGPGLVHYFMNPNVGTHLAGKARDDAQRSAPLLKLIDGSFHPSQRRARAAIPQFAAL